MSTPVFQKLTLDGGLRLITAPMPHSRSVAISLFIGTGSRYEEENEAGISHFIEHMLFKGTAKRPTPVDICLPIEGTGGVINAATDKELTIYWCKVPQPHFAEALDVIADIVLSSKFDPGEIEKERQVIIEEINMSLDSPAQRVSMLIDEIMWPDHALGRDVAGTKQSVAAISREMMLSYLGRHYQPHNAVLAVAGGIRHEEVEETARRVFRGWENTAPGVRFSPYRPKNGRQVLVERRPTEQTHLCLALPGNSISDPDRFRLDLLNVVLGEGMTSRLFTEIRDRLGLAYSIQSYAEHFLDTGAMTIAAGVDNDKVRLSIEAITRELARLREEPISETELNKARELFKGRILLRMEDSRNVTGWLGGQEILTGQVLSVDEVMQIIDAITPEELLALARRLISGERLRLAVVGPVSPDEPLEELLKI